MTEGIMKHLIICDLDGSLLNHEGDVTAHSKKVLRHLESLGHKVIIATGRPHSGAIQIYDDLGIHNVLITDNGGSIQHPKDSTFQVQKTYIPKAITHALFECTHPYLDSAFYSDEKTVYAYKYDPRLRMFFSSLDKRTVIDKPFTDFDTEATGIIYLVQTPFIETFETLFKTSFNDHLSFRLWGKDQKHAIYEIYLKHVSKASAIEHVRQYYDIPHEHTIAFGDGVNDIEMIDYAALGVAMKNAMPEVLAVCDDVTKETNDEQGIANYLIHHFKLEF
jgi:Cof subfamily protein (haloacid dehalogenase superfamily)